MAEKKKLNPVLFIILATILNLVLIFVFFLVLTFLTALVLSKVEVSDGLYTAISLFVIILSFLLSFLVYKKILVLVNRKWDIGKGRE